MNSKESVLSELTCQPAGVPKVIGEFIPNFTDFSALYELHLCQVTTRNHLVTGQKLAEGEGKHLVIKQKLEITKGK